MSRYLDALYGSTHTESSPSSSSDEECTSSPEFMSMEEQRALYREERDDEEKNLIIITKEELLSGQSVLSMPKKVSFKHKIEKKKRNPSHHESLFIIQEEEQQEKDFIQAPTQMDKKWNHVYENNFEKSMTMIRKLPLQYVESDKMSIEKLNIILNEHSNNIKTNAKSEEPTLSIMKDSTHLIACSMMPYIFCANGPKDGKEYSTFLVYDTTLKKRYNLTEIYYGLQEHFRNRCFNFIPFVNKDTILVALGEALFCFDFDNAFIWYRPQQLLVKDPQNSSELSQWGKTSLSLNTKRIEKTTNHSYSCYGDKVWIFGGRSVNTGALTNQLVECKITVVHSSVKREVIFGSDPPLPRENHAQCQIENNIYIYGGNYMQPHQLLNDLHVFNTITRQWIEIDLSFSPPPLRNHSFSNCGNRYLYLIGGDLGENKINAIIYRYDTQTSRFSIVVSQHLRNSDTARAFHTTISLYDELFIVGGCTNLETGAIAGNAISLIHTLDHGNENEMTNFLAIQIEQQFLGTFQGYDTVLNIIDKNEASNDHHSKQLHVHRGVLAARSTYFSNLFKERCIYNDDGKLVIEISNYHFDSIQTFISFLYTGNILLPDHMDEHYLQEIVDISSMDHPKHEIFADIYNRRKLFMDSSASIIHGFKKDLLELYQRVVCSVDNIFPESCHENLYADVTIQLLDPHTNDIIHQLQAHKLFISRSTYIAAVFASKMEESTTGVIKFNEISLNGILCVLRYLYTTEIDIPIEIAIEVFVCSHLFQLAELSQHAKRIVIENITTDNVMDIVIIADMYNEHVIKNHGIKAIVEHYDEVSKVPHFSTLPENIKTEIHDKYIYHLKKKSKQIKTKNKHQRENSQ